MIRLALIALLLTACSPAMPPPPVAVNGIAVEYRAAPYESHGAAYWDEGVPVVGLHVMDVDPDEAWFTWAHEVCHLQRWGYPSEMAADCCAVQRMVSMGIPVDRSRCKEEP